MIVLVPALVATNTDRGGRESVRDDPGIRQLLRRWWREADL